ASKIGFTTFYTGYFKAYFTGSTVEDYPINFWEQQGAGLGSGITSWLHNSGYPKLNITRLGMNYTGIGYPNPFPTIANGFFGTTRSGYFLGTNATAHDPTGLIADDTTKVGGIFFNANDNTNHEVISIYGRQKITNVGTTFNSLDTALIMT